MKPGFAPVLRAVALSALAGGLLAVALVPLASRLPNFVVPDDGYFYARIAVNLASGRGSTFDGVHVTSGYHVPWALALAAVSKAVLVFSRDVHVHLGAHLALGCALGVATAWRFFHRWSLRVCALVVFVSTFSLTEMALAAPVLLWLLERTISGKSGRRELTLALALPLVRVDLAIVPLALGLLLARAERARGGLLAAAAVAGAALNLVVMKAAFGHYLGVAALIKIASSPGTIATLRENLTGPFALAAFVAHIALAVATLRLAQTRSIRIAVAGGLAFLLFHSAVSLLRPWYWTPSWLGLLFLFGVVHDHASQRLRDAAAAAIAAAFVAHAARSELFYRRDHAAAAAFLAELPAQVPPATRLYTYDNPGFLGLFSGFDVIDGDGLVNDHAYADRFLAGRLAGYLAEEGVCFFVGDDADADPILSIGGLVVPAADAERLLTVRRGRNNQNDFVLFRLRAAHCQR